MILLGHEFGYEERDAHAIRFLERNYKSAKPDMWLTSDMVARCVGADEKTSNGFEEMPEFDLYCAGFPCTPWSRFAWAMFSCLIVTCFAMSGC